MKKFFHFKTVLAVSFVSLLVVGFQNCSKYQYASSDLALSNGLNTDNLPDNSALEINQIPHVTGDSGATPPIIVGGGSTPPLGAGSTPPLGAGSTPVSTPLPPAIQLPVDEDDIECMEYANNEENEDESEDVDKKDGKKCDRKEKTEVAKKCYVEVDDDDDEKDLQAHCNKKFSGRSSSKNVGVAGLELRHLRGKLILTQDEIKHINLIEDFRGKLILCGVSVDKIVNTRGKIVLVDSKVAVMEDHKGTIKIIGTSVTSSISNAKTKIAIARTR